jgi:hypothetical protein
MKVLNSFFILLCLLSTGVYAQEGETTPSINDLLRGNTRNQTSSSFLTFQSNKVYACTSQYRLIGAHTQHQQLSAKEKEKSYFEMTFNQDFSRLSTFDDMVYSVARSTAKGRLYSKKVAIQGKTVYYKLRVFSAKGIYKSVFVPGYGNLIHDFVQCELKEI